MVHFDLIENVNGLIFKIRETENAFFFKGKITEIQVSGFISPNTGLEYIPLILVMFSTSIIFFMKRFKKEKLPENIPEINEENNPKPVQSTREKWIDRLNSLRFGLILSSLIEYWLFITINLTKGLMFKNKNIWEISCDLVAVSLIMIFTKEILDMVTMLNKLEYPRLRSKLGSEEEDF